MALVSAVVLLTAHRTLAGRPARLLFRDPHLAAVRAWRQGTLLALSAVPSAQRRRPAHTMKSYQPAAAYPASSGARNGRTTPPGGVAQNVAVVAALEEAVLAQRTRGECLAERIMQWAGTPRFLLIHLGWFATWIILNEHLIPGVREFDPYPFGFLTFVVSLEAIFLTLFVLISQNRLTWQAERRAHLDLQINLLAEQESTQTLALLERLTEHLGLSIDRGGSQELASPTDVRTVVTALDRTLPSPLGSKP
jgi:uncharacterized membrane protein